MVIGLHDITSLIHLLNIYISNNHIRFCSENEQKVLIWMQSRIRLTEIIDGILTQKNNCNLKCFIPSMLVLLKVLREKTK